MKARNSIETLATYQGLASFYEKTENWPQAIETQRKLGDLANEGCVGSHLLINLVMINPPHSGDATKCAEALQKILKTHREHGSSSEVCTDL